MKIFVTLATVLVLLLVLEQLYAFGLRHNQNIKLANIALRPKNVPLLFHGPCEPLWMISPAIIKERTGLDSYNLALSHSDFADNYIHLYMYLKTNRAPRWMFLYVTPESLDKAYNTFNSFRFAPYLGDAAVRDVVNEADPSYARWARLPFMQFAYYNRRINFEVIQGYRHFFSGKADAYYPDGFEPPARRVWGNHGGKFVELYTRNAVFRIDILRVKYLVKTIRLAKEHGTRVFLYESPVLAEALKWQPNRPAMLNFIDSIAQSEKVSYVRFDHMAMASDRRYFISTLSLNMEGVRLFNDSLAGFLRSAILNEQGGSHD